MSKHDLWSCCKTLTKTASNGTTKYTWDFENRLTSVTLPSGAVTSFKYDPFGRRIEKIGPNGTAVYVYDGDNVIEQLDGGGNLVTSFTQGLGIDEPLAMYSGANSYYYEADGLGSVTSLSDSTGKAAETYTYDSFGNVTASTGNVSNPFQYTSREFDSETNLYYYRARYYDPITGRFLSEDPIGFVGSEDFYSYARNNPVAYFDPFGLSDIVVTVNRTTTTGVSTTGTLSVTVDGQYQFNGYSLEPVPTGAFPRVPAGVYPAAVYSSPRLHGTNVLLLKHVPGRSMIEIHPGNTPHDTHGCILPGLARSRDFVGYSMLAFSQIMQVINRTIHSDRASGQTTTIEVHIQ